MSLRSLSFILNCMMSAPSAIRAPRAGRPRFDGKNSMYRSSTAFQSTRPATTIHSSFMSSFMPQDWLKSSKVICSVFSALYMRFLLQSAGILGRPLGFLCT